MNDAQQIGNDTDQSRATYKRVQALGEETLSVLKEIESGVEAQMPKYSGEDAKACFEGLKTSCGILFDNINYFNETFVTAGIDDANRIDENEQENTSNANKWMSV